MKRSSPERTSWHIMFSPGVERLLRRPRRFDAPMKQDLFDLRPRTTLLTQLLNLLAQCGVSVKLMPAGLALPKGASEGIYAIYIITCHYISI